MSASVDESSDVVVQPSRDRLLVHAAQGDSSWDAAEPGVPGEPDVLAVVVEPGVGDRFARLEDRVVDDLGAALRARRATTPLALRLIMSDAGESTAGAPSVAARLSHRLGCDVFAPRGKVLRTHHGVFADGAFGAWGRFRDGAVVGWSGPRCPAPVWQSALDQNSTTRSRALVRDVPAGLWVRAGGPDAPDERAALAVPVAPTVLTILVGGRSVEAPDRSSLADVVAGLPADVRERTMFVGLGDQHALLRTVRSLARRFGCTFLFAHGVPRLDDNGRPEFAMVTETGQRTWQPMITASAVAPDGSISPTLVTPLPDLAATSRTVFELGAGWAAELLPSAVLVRPARAEVDSELRARVPDPLAFELIIDGSAQQTIPAVAAGAAGRLAAALGQRMGDYLRCHGTGPMTDAVARAVSGALVLAPIEAQTTEAQTTEAQTTEAQATGGRVVPPAAGNRLVLPLDRAAASAPLATRAVAPPDTVAADGTSARTPAVPPAGAPTAVPPRAEAAALPEVVAEPAPAKSALRDWSDHHSTAGERESLRLLLGWRYDAAVKHVVGFLSEQPGMRVAGDDAGLAELAAAHIFVSGQDDTFAAAVDAGVAAADDEYFVSCLVAGLRRLPTFTGVSLTTGESDVFGENVRVGDHTTSAAPMLAAAASTAGPATGVDTLHLIWSTTGRRIGGLVADPDHAARDVAFVPGTDFLVVGVDRTETQLAVLHMEVPAAARGVVDPKRRERIEAKLRSSLDRLRDPVAATASGASSSGASWA